MRIFQIKKTDGEVLAEITVGATVRVDINMLTYSDMLMMMKLGDSPIENAIAADNLVKIMTEIMKLPGIVSSVDSHASCEEQCNYIESVIMFAINFLRNSYGPILTYSKQSSV